MMQDLRTWLEAVENIGQLEVVSGAHWNLEMGALVGLVAGKQEHPALLFDKIPDYEKGGRVLGCAMTTPGRVAVTFDIQGNPNHYELAEEFRQKLPGWEKGMRSFPPKAVNQAAFLENIQTGKDINLWTFPSPLWCELDIGRYIGTGDAVVTRDPDTGEINVGTYRIMVHDEKTLGLFIAPGKHGRIHVEKYRSRGQDCPVAVSFGHHPLVFGIAALEVPSGAEYNFLGAVRNEPYPVFIEEITGLPVPADSEIIVVGRSPAGKTREEGPFSEWTGYYASKQAQAPIIEVERVYYRHNPVILGVPNSNPAQSAYFRYYRGVIKSAMLHNELEKAGLVGVRAVSISEAFGEQWVVVSITQRYAGHAKQAALLASQSRSSVHMGRYVVVVDDDIDPRDIDEVIWAICTRSDPVQDIDIIRRTWSSPLDPIIRKPAEAFFNSRGIIDACKPFEWKDEFPKEIIMDQELAKRVKGKWGDIFV
ncbi:MAG: UbiD family decarboxylase [Dehalococcoidia bacterium]|nr:UbiD family decarboxylase [Dehalococcoidia bacterium]MDZ4246452.1 UbiD family decarboxylase [Dehalococcoidia bacterium]